MSVRLQATIYSMCCHLASLYDLAINRQRMWTYLNGNAWRRDFRLSNVTIGKTETTNHVDFTNHFMTNDEGWICGSKGELLMSIPMVDRDYFRCPSTTVFGFLANGEQFLIFLILCMDVVGLVVLIPRNKYSTTIIYGFYRRSP